MKTKPLSTGTKGLWLAVVIVSLMLAFASRSEAGFKTVIDGISVSYSGDGANAYYDPNDGTLTVAVSQSGGSLNIIVGPNAYLAWGTYTDIYILADGATLKSINIKGALNCTPFVAGQVNYVTKFTLLGGVVGDTDYYGQDFGLGMVSSAIPVSISLKKSYATAQLFGYPNATARPEPLSAAPPASGERLTQDSQSTKNYTTSTAVIDKRSLIERLQATPR
ncbi:MAG: hypothetical protein HY298_23690 [Verrucomicrobia bacterium]|nr:hypothetical protein [Verrucomicrobiota bacterium]